jgi:hypothetical protein
MNPRQWLGTCGSTLTQRSTHELPKASGTTSRKVDVITGKASEGTNKHDNEETIPETQCWHNEDAPSNGMTNVKAYENHEPLLGSGVAFHGGYTTKLNLFMA